MVVRFSLKLTLKMRKHLDKPPAFQFYVKDWLTDWRMLTLDFELKCIYMDLLCLTWLEESTSLPNDIKSLAKICRTSNEKIQQILTLFFTEKEGKIYSKKLKLQKERLMEIRKERQKAGKKGGQAIAKQMLSKRVSKHASKKQAKEDEDEDEKENTIRSNNNINKIGEFYEKNIGMLTPYVCEELQELEKQHKEHNVLKALKLTAEAGVRSIRYVKAILDSEAAGGYKFEKLPKTIKDPLLGKLPPVVRKQVESMIESFIQNTGEQPKEANIKLMIEKITHEKA